MLRKQIRVLALICVLVTLISCLTGNVIFAAEFSDVSTDDMYYDCISEISDMGIVNGYDDGTFRPSNKITKAEMSVMIARMIPYDSFDSSQYPQLFKDISSDYWAYPYISKAAYCGVFSTFDSTDYNDEFLGNTSVTKPNIENDVFSPDSYVTYADAVKAVTTLLGYNGTAEKNGGFPNGYLFVAKVFGFADGVKEYQYNENITRADFALMASNALDVHWCIANTDDTETQLINAGVDFIKYDGYIIYSKSGENTLRDILAK